jgi:hypothetical protein
MSVKMSLNGTWLHFGFNEISSNPWRRALKAEKCGIIFNFTTMNAES